MPAHSLTKVRVHLWGCRILIPFFVSFHCASLPCHTHTDCTRVGAHARTHACTHTRTHAHFFPSVRRHPPASVVVIFVIVLVVTVVVAVAVATAVVFHPRTLPHKYPIILRMLSKYSHLLFLTSISSTHTVLYTHRGDTHTSVAMHYAGKS